MRGVVDALTGSGRREAIAHAHEIRPWGRFTVLQKEEARASAPGFKVKEVVVDGHGRTTLQLHPGRDEIWVVVEGEAVVFRDGEEFSLRPGGSITVPRGTRHRLTNPTGSRLRLIEIGYGEALEDEDTVRLEE